MAVSDWTYLFSGGTTQNATIYGVVPAPNGTSGGYARSITTPGNQQFGGFIPSNVSFTGVPSTKAIRIQSFFRRNTSSTGFALSAKCVSSNPFNTGYRLSMSPFNLNELVFVSPNSGGGTLLHTVSTNVWISLRMTVYPIGPTIDRIICEQESSPGSGVWSSTFSNGSGDFMIDQSVTPTRYVSWGGSTVNGIFAVNNGGANEITLLDMMQVSLANVPTPIP